MEWLEKKGYHLMTASIILQCIIFVALIVLYLMAQNKIHDIIYNIYAWSVVALFMAYMIHFAYHSIQKAYFIELIAFLIMSTISSAMLVYYFFAYVIGNDEFQEDMKSLCNIIGIISIILLCLGNIIYFLSAYFAYNHFELIFLNKFGAKALYHKIFSWMQFQHSMMKSDLGLNVFLIVTTLIFDNDLIILSLIDVILLISGVVVVYYMRMAIREENTKNTYLILGFRIFLELYFTFRAIYFLHIDENSSQKKKDFHDKFIYGYVSVIGTVCFDAAIFICIIVSTVKCVSLYDKGFKEMIMKQKQVSEKTEEEKREYYSTTFL